MKINGATKISKIIKFNPDAIKVISSINPQFKRLKNPILRKVLAPRVTIEDAARIGKCSVEDFFDALIEMGFEVEHQQDGATDKMIVENIEIMSALNKGKITSIDVRPILEKNVDPFNFIMEELRKLPKGIALEVVNSFEPTPLVKILNKKGYASYIVNKEELVKTYFLKVNDEILVEENVSFVCTITSFELEKKKEKYGGGIREIDVRNLEMPLPMVTILNELENLSEDQALYVHHKKVPQYLLPELESRKVITWVAEIEESNVKLLIHR